MSPNRNILAGASPPTVVVLHRGGPIVRGTEAVLIRSAKALTASGYRLIVCRRNNCIDTPPATLAHHPEFADFSFPELMLADPKDCSLPIGSDADYFAQTRGI